MSDRLTELRKIIKGKNLDGIILTGRPNTFYLSGFSGSTSYLLVGMQQAWLIVDFRYTIQAKLQACKGVEVIEQTDSFMLTLNQLLSDYKIQKVGFEGNNLNYSEFESFKNKLTQANLFVNVGSEIDLLRIKKDENEIEIIAQAVLMGDRVFDHILKIVKPGMREDDLATEIDYQMKKLGAKGPSFDTIVASGERSAMCHATPSENILKKGDSLVLDFGLNYHHYCSDMTRTIFIGDPGDEMKRIYNIVKDAQQAALDCIISGMPARDADKIARTIITHAGYGSCFGHSLGHGVGIEIHEDPRLAEKSEAILSDGMVFTIEPGIYVEGLGGVRIEDMVVLVNGKPRNLTTSTKSMIVI